MPFTPSHAAAALPFLRTPLPVAAVVLGSVAPDLPYFVPVGIPREWTHEPLGAITIDPLIGLAALTLWWAVFRAPVLDLAPAAIRQRMRPRVPLGADRPLPAALGLVVAGVLLGIATHLVWDWFTHPAGFVDLAPAWRAPIGPFPVYRWLQYLSSAGGLLALAIWARGWMRRTPPESAPALVPDGVRRASWVAIAVIGVLVAVGVWIAGVRGGDALLAPSLGFRLVVTGIGVAGALAVAICLCWQAFRLTRPRREPVGD